MYTFWNVFWPKYVNFKTKNNLNIVKNEEKMFWVGSEVVVGWVRANKQYFGALNCEKSIDKFHLHYA